MKNGQRATWGMSPKEIIASLSQGNAEAKEICETLLRELGNAGITDTVHEWPLFTLDTLGIYGKKITELLKRCRNNSRIMLGILMAAQMKKVDRDVLHRVINDDKPLNLDSLLLLVKERFLWFEYGENTDAVEKPYLQ